MAPESSCTVLEDAEVVDGFIVAPLKYNRKPPPGKWNGVSVDSVGMNPGVPAFAFHRQHGSIRFERPVEELTGFIAAVSEEQVRIKDARRIRGPPASLESHYGFELRNMPLGSSLSIPDLYDEQKVQEVYYSEVSTMVRAALAGCTEAFCFDHVRRIQSEDARRASDGKPSYMVHSDSTLRSWPLRLSELVSNETFKALGPPTITVQQANRVDRANRFVVVNVWRLLTPSCRTQLALCDPASVDMASDTIDWHFVSDGCVGYNYGLHCDRASQHEWYYYPGMSSDEVLLFKAFDSGNRKLTTNDSKWVFHCAFDDPRAPLEAPPRDSIEVRVLALFEDQPADIEHASAADEDQPADIEHASAADEDRQATKRHRT